MRSASLIVGLGLVLSLAATAGATNGPRLTANGARTGGRGGVDYAYADDGTGPSTNPAGMAFVFGNRLDQYWAIVDPHVTWTNSAGKFADDSDLYFPLPAFSFGAFIDPYKSWDIAPLFDLGRWGLDKPADAATGPPLSEEESTLGSRLRLGFGVFPVTGGDISIRKMRTPAFANPLDWEVNTLALAVTPSVAFRINRYFSIGVNAQFIYSRFVLDGGIAQPRFLLADNFEFASTLINSNPQIETQADIDDAFTYGVSGRIGAMFQTELLSVGLVYQDRSYSADYLGRATVDATDEVNRLTQGNPGILQLVDGGINPSLGFTSVYDLRIQGYEFPRMAGLGVALRPHRRFSVGLDYTFINYRAQFNTFKTRLSNGSNPNLDIMTSPSIAVRLPLKYRDQHVLALGVTALLAEGQDLVEGVPAWTFSMRAGYNYGRTPARRNTTIPQLPVITEHHVSGGFTFGWGPLLEFTASVEYALPKTFTVGPHIGDIQNLSNSKQVVSILIAQFGIGVNF